MSHDHLCRSDLSREKLLDNVLRLQRHRAVRDDQGLYWVEGPRGVIQAIESGRRVEHLLVSERLLAVPYAEKLVRLQQRFGVPATRLSPEEFRRLNLTPQASGIGAVVRCHWTRLHQSPPTSGLCWVVLHHIRSAGNLGTLVRTCEALGVAGLMFIGPDIDPFDPAVVRASMGGLFHVRLVRCSADSLKHWVRRHRCDVVAAAPDARESYRSARYRKPLLLMLGEERQGLSVAQRSLEPRTVSLPMVGRADSLNVGVAGSVMLYEVFHRIGPRGAFA